VEVAGPHLPITTLATFKLNFIITVKTQFTVYIFGPEIDPTSLLIQFFLLGRPLQKNCHVQKANWLNDRCTLHKIQELLVTFNKNLQDQKPFICDY